MSARISLAARLDLPGAQALLRDLKSADGDVVLDASEVRMFGALGAETILVALRDFGAQGRTLKIEGLNDATAAQIERLGLTPARLVAEA